MTSFEQLGIQPSILENLRTLGFLEPTEIQEKAIPLLLNENRDFIGLAQTGTGKTAAFGLPCIQQIDPGIMAPQALIIAPTRELCIQISLDLKKFAKNMWNIRILAVYGGSPIGPQIRALKEGTHIVVATPGRLVDMIERKVIAMDDIQRVILDEADEMLNMGFKEDMEFILSNTPEEKLTALFSATMSKEIREIASNFLNDPLELTIGRKNLGHPNISHQYAVLHAKDKIIALRRIIDYNSDFYGIVFCNTKKETQELNDALLKEGYAVECIHGDLEQAQREKVMSKFRNKYVTVLFATDVAARGIDVKNLTHIIHFHLPDDIENYTHRSGRTARAGQKGISIALLHIKEAYKLHRIEKAANLKFERFWIPTANQVAEKRITSFVQKLVEDAQGHELKNPPKNEWTWPLMQLSKEQMAEIILRSEMERYSAAYLATPDVNVQEKVSTQDSYKTESTSRRQKSRGGSGGEGFPVRMFINLGKMDQLKYDELREVVFKLTKISGRSMRDIDMFNSYSFFMTDEQSAKKLAGLKGIKWNKREIQFKRADDKKERRRR